ncbi:MAG: LamG domain-containing protein [Gammaproteobacteria bacterium]|nr:LamG domain-containing protein [Gammaproteobacteria bacterium]
MNRTAPALRLLAPLARGAALAALATLAACAGGAGPGTSVNQVATPPTSTASSYTGPAPANADVQAFALNLWANIRVANRCGGCHHEGGQSPMFARSDDVNLAYQAALPLVNLTSPDQSMLVLKVGGGHNCWVADPSACASTMLQWIKNWVGAGSASTTSVTLVAPPVQSAGGSKQYPADPNSGSPSFATTVYPLLKTFCSGCHTSSSATAQQPYFASSDVNEAYLAAQPKMNLAQPNQSRFYQRLATEFHHCWVTPSSGGAPDCPGSAAAMLAAITAFANGIPVTQLDPSLVVSDAVTLKQGTVAAGGSRYEANLIAKYMFQTGSGSTAYDTSGVTPAADLALSGNVSWVGGWGINIGMGGKAQASTSTSQKLAAMIQSSGEYSIEAWVAPANVTQTAAYIVSYSGSNTTRDMTLGQAAMQYQAMARSSASDTNGMPALTTTTNGGAAQAALQHVVVTYDPVNGQKVYVNGVYTGDADPAKGGTFANWDNTFALVLGNETTGQRQWQGVIKFVALHNRALNAAQIQQNFAAGVGEKYFLLFGVSSLSGVSKSYIVFQASQYDSYSYLFYQPKFVSLDPNAAAPANLKISGMRLGVNGSLAPAGQSYTTMNATVGGGNYTAANGQLLSGLGTVVPGTLGPANDLFFLAFDQFGSHVHPYVEPVVTIAPPTPDNSARADFGVATFERAFHSMARVTGVPITNPTVMSLYMSEQQSLPSTPDIAAFLPSHQTAISQLASAFCSQLVTNQAYRDAFFGTGLDAAINSGGAAFFGPSGSANRALVVNTLASKIFGANVLPSAQLAAQAEANALLTRIPTLQGYGNATVGTETTAVCTAVLGSAALSLQ